MHAVITYPPKWKYACTHTLSLKTANLELQVRSEFKQQFQDVYVRLFNSHMYCCLTFQLCINLHKQKMESKLDLPLGLPSFILFWLLQLMSLYNVLL